MTYVMKSAVEVANAVINDGNKVRSQKPRPHLPPCGIGKMKAHMKPINPQFRRWAARKQWAGRRDILQGMARNNPKMNAFREWIGL
jgi:hypothetical protein